MPTYTVPLPIKTPAGQDAWYRFMSSLPLPDEIMKASCIVKAWVKGVYSHDKVNVFTSYVDPNNPEEIIKVIFEAVPVWCNTDFGARGARLADIERVSPADYFKYSAYRFPFLGQAVDQSECIVGLLLYQPPLDNNTWPPKEALGVCCVFDSFFSLYAGMVYKLANVAQYMHESVQLYEYARPSYHPYLRLTLIIYMTYGITNNYGAVRFLVDMKTGQVAQFPTYYIVPDNPELEPFPLAVMLNQDGSMYEWYHAYYTQGIPMAPMRLGAHYTMDQQLLTLTHMNAFLNRSVRVKSEDCFIGWNETASGDASLSGIFSLDFSYNYDYNSMGELELELGPDDPAWGYVVDSQNFNATFKDRDSGAFLTFTKQFTTVATEAAPNGQVEFTFNTLNRETEEFELKTLSFSYKWQDPYVTGVTGMSRFKHQFTKNNLYDTCSIGAIYTEFTFGTGASLDQKCFNGTMTKCEIRTLEANELNLGPSDPLHADYTPRYTLKDALEAVKPYCLNFTSSSVQWKTTRMRLVRTDLFLVPYDPRIAAIPT